MSEPSVPVAINTNPENGQVKSLGVLTVTLLVALVLASLGAVLFLACSLLYKPNEAKWSRARTDMIEIGKAVNTYAIEHRGKLPPNLAVLIKAFPDGVPEDPFTELPYTYVVHGDDFALTCLGSDNKIGGKEMPDKDIVVTKAGFDK